VLRRFLTEKTPGDSSWQNPNRRFVHQGLYLPSAVNEPSGTVVVVIDTSGSIGPKELMDFGSEVEGIKQDVRPNKTYVIYCDAAVNRVDEFGPDDELELEAVGGGGTDFRPPFDWLDENGIHPSCLVYLTDGYGTFPDDDEISFPTLWAMTTDVESPLGETLSIQ
jgi:predicted metal-dependent peptidase